MVIRLPIGLEYGTRIRYWAPLCKAPSIKKNAVDLQRTAWCSLRVEVLTCRTSWKLDRIIIGTSLAATAMHGWSSGALLRCRLATPPLLHQSTNLLPLHTSTSLAYLLPLLDLSTRSSPRHQLFQKPGTQLVSSLHATSSPTASVHMPDTLAGTSSVAWILARRQSP
jgi:hypothetical protein